MVNEPNTADRQEAREIGQVGGPLLEDPGQEIVELVGRDRELQDEQRDRDREHAVAERLQPVGLEVVAHPRGVRV